MRVGQKIEDGIGVLDFLIFLLSSNEHSRVLHPFQGAMAS